MSQGLHLIAGNWEPGTGASFTSFDPHTGNPSEREYREADPEQVRRAVEAAAAHVSWKGFASPAERSQLLSAIADALDSEAETIVATADCESGLGRERLNGELARTTGQIRAFADFLATGEHSERIEDSVFDGVSLVRMDVPLGPVAVFEASNFPLAFATMGGDTVSALAAGCPVVVKAHPSHPETSEMVARIAARVLDAAGLGGVMSLLHGPSPQLGEALVTNPEILAVGFTGSLQGGRALMDAASRRPIPIPVYAEMGSVNPLIVTEAAAATRAEEIATGFVGSLLLGSGQFCTKPGLLIVPDSAAGQRLVDRAAAEVTAAGDHVLLNERIQSQFQTGCDNMRKAGTPLADTRASEDGYRVGGMLVEIDPPLDDLAEVFGPAGVVVRYSTKDDLVALISSLPGALAAAVHAVDDDPDEQAILAAVSERVGRVVWNGYPTGVAVSRAMMHGGPYPASSDGRHTSVGLRAMRRFQRPVAFQGVPSGLLPDAN
jgi:acyl-CoA reductase-like NAD-dependent aldehyde dehydrogenase